MASRLSTREQFLTEIDAFKARTDVSDRQIGIGSVRDAAFVYTVRQGRQPRADVIDRVLAWIDAYRAPE